MLSCYIYEPKASKRFVGVLESEIVADQQMSIITECTWIPQSEDVKLKFIMQGVLIQLLTV